MTNWRRSSPPPTPSTRRPTGSSPSARAGGSRSPNAGRSRSACSRCSPTTRPARFAAHPVFTDLCHDLVGPDVRLYHDQAVYKQPEKPRRFPWHQDNGYTFVEPQQYLTCWVALTDATLDNGCPHIVPGLHRLGTLRHHFTDPLGWEIFEDHPDAIAAPVAKGGIVVFSSLSPHLTGPNTTGAMRKAYILQYAPDGAQVFRGDTALPKPEPERGRRSGPPVPGARRRRTRRATTALTRVSGRTCTRRVDRGRRPSRRGSPSRRGRRDRRRWRASPGPCSACRRRPART